jgi:predicted Zn-dependent peptidase
MIALTRFDNGVSILSRQLPGRRSAALGIWIARGSRDDARGHAGCAHLLEHLIFRGIERHSGLAERIGGTANAATSRELILFHGTTPGERLDALASMLSELLADPALDAAGLRCERDAVLHEIAETAGSFEALRDELLARVWPEHPLARPPAGDPAVVRAIPLQALRASAGALLHGPGITVVAAGAVRHDALVAACRVLEGLPGLAAPRSRVAPSFQSVERHRHAACGRSLLIWAMPVAPFGAGDEMLELAERIVAGDAGCGRVPRLLRDRLGLVYGVGSRLELYSDCGLWWLHLECDPWQAGACREAVEAVFHELFVTGIGPDEIRRSQAGLQARWVVEDDDPEAVIERIAREAIALGRVRSLDERRAALTGADPESLRVLIHAAWKRRALFTIGPHAGAAARTLCA